MPEWVPWPAESPRPDRLIPNGGGLPAGTKLLRWDKTSLKPKGGRVGAGPIHPGSRGNPPPPPAGFDGTEEGGGWSRHPPVVPPPTTPPTTPPERVFNLSFTPPPRAWGLGGPKIRVKKILKAFQLFSFGLWPYQKGDQPPSKQQKGDGAPTSLLVSDSAIGHGGSSGGGGGR